MVTAAQSERAGFVLSPVGPSARTAHCLSRAALLSYSLDDDIRTGTEAWGMRRSEFVSRKGTQCWVGWTDSDVVLAFRGTEIHCVMDVLTGLDARKGPYLIGGSVHRGFKRALDVVWPSLLHVLDTALGSGKRRLYVTGHSLGGALATLAAARAHYLGAGIGGVYTFGSPRVGDRHFANAYNAVLGSRTFRYRNNNDIVARLPPASPQWLRSLLKLRCVPGGYRHVGRLLYFDHCGKLHEKPGAWERFIDALQGRLADLGKWGTDGIKDHSISRYVELCAE